MPALINNRLAAAFEAIPVEERSAEHLALAAEAVMQDMAKALELPATGVAYFEPGGHKDYPESFVVSWLDGPAGWALSAQEQDEPRFVAIYSCDGGMGLQFWPVSWTGRP